MGIFDEAIQEHLELKRRHGAGDSELKQLEDEAFGPPERPGGEEVAPDPFAEAPTEFMAQPETAEARGGRTAGEAPARRRAADIADLQEAPEPESRSRWPGKTSRSRRSQPKRSSRRWNTRRPVASGRATSTEERHAIADQPTEMFDVEEEFAPRGCRPPPTRSWSPRRSPSRA